ncbi:MarR family winged helix-turn-helix transcriptional regulator [Brachybacterium sp. AOP43-C2-M15]|uniref:MarR family winged helix-turn-helix transcriptional regulator n=1 Tax=Brachybacterium sp. AOP43-C2-M15 TaxID=3457661 RepID=UPI00403471DC
MSPRAREGATPEDGNGTEASAADPSTGAARPADLAGPTEVEVGELAAELQRVLLVSSRILRSQTASEDVSVPQFSVLAFLQRAGESTPGALADFEHVSPPVMTRTLGRLEGAGLVHRTAHPGDGRQVRVTLTAAGEQVVLAGRERRDAWLRSRIEAAAPAEREALREAARVMRGILIPPRE